MGIAVDRGLIPGGGSDEHLGVLVRESDRWVELVLKASSDAAIVCDDVGLISALNDQAAALSGRDRMEALGKPFELVFPLTGNHTSQHDAEYSEPRTLTTKTGDVRRVQVRVIPLAGLSTNGGVLHLLRDLTDREKLLGQAAALGGLSTLSALVSQVAHDLNNPLTSSLGSLDLARSTVTRLRQDPALPHDAGLERVALLLDSAHRGAERVAQLVADLRALGRGADQAPEEALDVVTCVDDALRLVASALRTKAKVVREVRARPTVLGRTHDLTQVFANVLLNAAQALANDEMGEIRVSVEERGADAMVSITDTGHGLQKEHLLRVFEPFFTTQPGFATGLGLTASEHTVRAMGGHIEIENVDPHGARVTITLPKQGKSRTISSPPPSESPRDDLVKVLLVDDELSLGAVLAELLVDEGYQVIVLRSAQQALSMLEKTPDIDVVLCDVMMPGMDGIELYEKVAAERPEFATRFVFMTGGSVSQRTSQFLANTKQPCLTKPLDVRNLAGVLATVSQRASITP